MIAYSTLGTNDMDRAIAFYDAVFGALGGFGKRRARNGRDMDAPENGRRSA
jgi:hypothetical protein